ncbi:MAG: alpha/beta fold hydrolase [Desulfatitalea sp.]|nr:alpha/beta fold hydrolase [Desulfatitalea sp.]NNK01519.1 alpha/beta fold hydrolase [Desulfatitalea sp.]
MAIKTLSSLFKARVNLHATENIPQGAKIFVINHFTRIETLLVPYYLHALLKKPIWSLASYELFFGALGRFLESVGTISTKDPDRDRLIVKSLLTHEADWIIFPEGRMVKSKKIIEKGRYIVSYAGGKHPPHTGAAHLALRTEFYRRRLLGLGEDRATELERLRPMFNLAEDAQICTLGTSIVPVNITYYPLRAKINALHRMAKRIKEDLPENFAEELMTEGAMLLDGVDIDIRFGKPIEIAPYLQVRSILKDIRRPEPFGFDDPLTCLADMRKAALKIMQRYMGAIYALTTVNHDHIFASLLKNSVRQRVKLEDFCRRAFLAIHRGAAPSPFHLHTSLKEEQSHLLLDDRFNRLSDFLAVAQETGVVHRQAADLHTNRRKLRTIFDFHRARIDHPIAVMANEVEPLIRLQRNISRLCWTPSFVLRRRIFHYFKEKAELEFEQDYKQYYLEGESKSRSNGRPILIRGRSRRLGVVLCHGYMAAPPEVKTLAEFLGRRGYWVYAPRLKGHATAPEDLATRSFKDWIRSVEEAYLLMHNACRHVVVGGFSTGAALALELAARVNDLAGVFAISAPLRLQYAAARLTPLVDKWNRLMTRMRWEEAKKEFVTNNPENPNINYMRNPISGVRELERLMDQLEPRLQRIQIPAMVVQSEEDPVVHPKGSERIFQLLGSVDKQYVAFNFKRHGIILGEGSERVHRAIGDFIHQLPIVGGRSQPMAAMETKTEG